MSPGFNFDVLGDGHEEPESAEVPRFAVLSRMEHRLAQERECNQALRERRREDMEAKASLTFWRAMAGVGWAAAILISVAFLVGR